MAALVAQAERLTKAPDPKLDALLKLLKPLDRRGRQSGRVLPLHRDRRACGRGACAKAFPKLRIEAVTGELPSEERRARVEAMGEAEQRLLVATDCLSEGINLQSLFDTVIHYDLSWNPTRHQQREGRVDRFGQPAPARALGAALLARQRDRRRGARCHPSQGRGESERRPASPFRSPTSAARSPAR